MRTQNSKQMACQRAFAAESERFETIFVVRGPGRRRECNAAGYLHKMLEALSKPDVDGPGVRRDGDRGAVVRIKTTERALLRGEAMVE